MDFINHTLNWCKGEIFEGKMSILFGVVLLLISFAFFKWGTTPYAKSIVGAFLIISFFAIATGVYLYVENSKRIENYPSQFDKNHREFAETEKERTEAFIKVYPITLKVFFVLMIIGMLCITLSDTPLVRTIGIGLILICFYGYILDHFSQERAVIYHTHIENYLTS